MDFHGWTVRLNLLGDAVDGHQAPSCDGLVAEAVSDLFCTFGVFVPATIADLHSGQRHTHVSPILGMRRIDYIALPETWRKATQWSWIDTTMDLLSPSEDHFLAMVRFEGSFPPLKRHSTRPPTRITAKALDFCTQESIACFWQAINDIPVPSWHLDVHGHKKCLTDAIHIAGEQLERKHVFQAKPYSNDVVMQLSKSRSFYLRSRASKRSLISRSICFRFFVAWRCREAPDLRLECVAHPHEFCLRIETAWPHWNWRAHRLCRSKTCVQLR